MQARQRLKRALDGATREQTIGVEGYDSWRGGRGHGTVTVGGGPGPEHQQRVDRLAAKTYELTDFLVNVLNVKATAGSYNGKITYHDSCAGLREMGVKTQPRTLLATMPGVELIEMADCETCCGFGGTFALKYGDISARLADNKCVQVQNSGADAVVLGDLGCMLNVEGRLRRRGDAKTRVLHVAEVLAGEA